MAKTAEEIRDVIMERLAEAVAVPPDKRTRPMQHNVREARRNALLSALEEVNTVADLKEILKVIITTSM